MKEQRLPDSAGWWARHDSGRIQWFKIEMVSATEGPPYIPEIFIDDIGQYTSVKSFSTPLTRWFGPIETPWDK